MYRYVWSWWKICEVGKSFEVVILILIWWFGDWRLFKNSIGIFSFFKVEFRLCGLYGLNWELRYVCIGVMNLLEE